MELYTLLRHLADSWALLALVLFFIGVIFWVNRPGAQEVHEEAANSIFRNEDKPKDDDHGR